MIEFEPKEGSENVISILVVVTMIIGMVGTVYFTGKLAVTGFQYAEARRATAECEKLADQATVFERWDPETGKGFYITAWQKDQCDAHGVAVNAEIINQVVSN